ncbi:CC_3452 family protein [Sphingomonas psychrolutea]|uniref:Uncharacterized protein n=1 Tax=Sphingomonas psychrolutea TaxID=1259676 RepID=A0ABQ1GL39_9SPHN|nr:hypothetical protein [Sphingomonas psychrolutea]GGA45709.1 hypothetical protein GCM10011395_14890 [Sphingomonas psychrolutea]
MTRLLSLAAAALVSAASLSPIVAHAADAGPYYAATPVAAPTKTLLITNGTVWKWNTTAFTANKGPQREAIMCEMVVKSAGKLASFSAGGQSFDAPALEKCNARAK